MIHLRLVTAILALSSILGTPKQVSAVECAIDADYCAGERSSLVAVSHDFQSPQKKVLYRVKVPEWSTGTEWGDGTNGFFYQTTDAFGTVLGNYVPLAGFAVGQDQRPAIPAFSFIVPVDVSVAAPGLTISACASNGEFVSGESSGEPRCSETLWSETFGPLPSPSFGQVVSTSGLGEPVLSPTGITLPNNGLYAAAFQVNFPGGPYDAAEQQWILDHLVFFVADGSNQSGTVHTNDLATQHVAVLPFDEATYLNPHDGRYYTRYGTGQPIDPVDFPNALFFLYTTASPPSGTSIYVGVQTIYDASDDCTAVISGHSSSNPDCDWNTTPPVSFVTELTVNPLYAIPNDQNTRESGGIPAGWARHREIKFGLESQGADCDQVVNPMAVNSLSHYNPPNYQVGNLQNAVPDFSPGLYHVVDTGFGNCVDTFAGDFRPLCAENSQARGYAPHYLANEGGGDLDSGDSAQPFVTSAKLADEYALPGLNASQNSLVYFDSCGYYHTYAETRLSDRLSVPASLPGDKKLRTRSIHNALGRDLVFAKECCASWYQPNPQQSSPDYQVPEPPHILDDGFGMFVPAGATYTYKTAFDQEAMAVWDATGRRLFKLMLSGTDGSLYRCEETANVTIDSEGKVSLGASGSDALSCGPIGACPFGMQVGQSDGLTTCTTTKSTFVPDVADWAQQVAAGESILLEVWGGYGYKEDSTTPGGGGYAQTVHEQSEIDRALYAYVGREGNDNHFGGSSSVLATLPLSSWVIDLSGVTVPSDVEVLLIAGGGGGVGRSDSSHSGGNGAVAIASVGIPTSTAGEDGGGSKGGGGGNQNGMGSAGHLGTTGIGGRGHETDWDRTGPLIPPENWEPGEGGNDNSNKGGRGGGGFGGGGAAKGEDSTSGDSQKSGGGGGGSWAAAATATESLAPSTAPTSPGGKDGAMRISYTANPVPCAPVYRTPENGGASAWIMQCTYQTSIEKLSLEGLVAGLFGPDFEYEYPEMPVYIEAFGAQGGGSPGIAQGGKGGYARTALELNVLMAEGDGELHLYAGAEGKTDTAGNDGNHGGGGGASTVVGFSPLDDVGASNDVIDPRLGDILLIAGGGGGSGKESGAHGGGGGIAIASTDEDVSCGGFPGSPGLEDPSNPEELAGRGGNGGLGLCDPGRTGEGGQGGLASGIGASDGSPGNSGLGGFGGRGGVNGGAWIGTNVSAWQSGNGGDSGDQDGPGAGGGGGGFGGGGGGATQGAFFSGGGGGGGSWARMATLADVQAPVVDRGSPPSLSGAVIIGFDVCAVDPVSPVCSGIAATSPAPLDVKIKVNRKGKIQRAWIMGSADLDVTQIDFERLFFGPTHTQARKIGRPRDTNRDGYPDLRLKFHARDSVGIYEGRNCIHGYLLDGTPVLGCS